MAPDEPRGPRTEPLGNLTPPGRKPPPHPDPPPTRRTWYVFRGTTLVGYTRFEARLAGLDRRAGRFHAGPGYADVRAAFRLYDEARRAPNSTPALALFVKARDALGLTIVDDTGGEVRGYVELISEWENGVVAIHAVLGRR